MALRAQPPPLTIARTFGWCEQDGWEVQAEGPCRLSTLAQDDRTTFVKMETVYDVAFARAAQLVRPEVYGDPALAEAYGYHESTLAREFSPGDALVKYTWAPGRTKCWALNMILSVQKWRQFSGEEGPVFMRHALRANFPYTGALAWVSIPVDEGRLVEQSGLSPPATCSFITPEDGGVRQTRIFRMPRWAFPVLKVPLQQFCVSACNASFLEIAQVPRLLADAYLVVRVRKCSAGPPLLPVAAKSLDTVASDSWQASEWAEFTLAAWLEALAHLTGCDLRAFGALDGNLLPRTAAAVRREDWAAAAPGLDRALKVQRAAYRRTFGGKNAPILVAEEGEHKALGREWEEELPALHYQQCCPGCDCPRCPCPRCPVKNTFVHFDAEEQDFQECQTV